MLQLFRFIKIYIQYVNEKLCVNVHRNRLYQTIKYSFRDILWYLSNDTCIILCLKKKIECVYFAKFSEKYGTEDRFSFPLSHPR